MVRRLQHRLRLLQYWYVSARYLDERLPAVLRVSRLGHSAPTPDHRLCPSRKTLTINFSKLATSSGLVCSSWLATRPFPSSCGSSSGSCPRLRGRARERRRRYSLSSTTPDAASSSCSLPRELKSVYWCLQVIPLLLFTDELVAPSVFLQANAHPRIRRLHLDVSPSPPGVTDISLPLND